MKNIKRFESYTIAKEVDLKTWFGSSKVVDSNRNPLVVYHGTSEDFTEFDINKINSIEPKGDYIGSGFYFTGDKEKAIIYAKASSKKTGKEPVIKKAFLKIENPLIITTSMDAERLRNSFGSEVEYYKIMKSNPAKIREELEKRGYDGLIDRLYNQYAVFNPDQIKVITDEVIEESITESMAEKIELPKLYHTTLKSNWDDIQKNGLDPNRSQSSLKAIFLSDDLYVARNYSCMRNGEDHVVLEIDPSVIDQQQLGPDNYELKEYLDIINDDLDTDYYRTADVPWEISLEYCNQVAYYAIIPASAITLIDEVNC